MHTDPTLLLTQQLCTDCGVGPTTDPTQTISAVHWMEEKKFKGLWRYQPNLILISARFNHLIFQSDFKIMKSWMIESNTYRYWAELIFCRGLWNNVLHLINCLNCLCGTHSGPNPQSVRRIYAQSLCEYQFWYAYLIYWTYKSLKFREISHSQWCKNSLLPNSATSRHI